MISTPINECISSPILPPPPEFTESSPLPEWVVTESDDLVVQEIELYTDDHPLNQTDSMETSQQELELFFPRRKSNNLAINSDNQLAITLSELSEQDTLLTDVTIHAFMVSILFVNYILESLSLFIVIFLDSSAQPISWHPWVTEHHHRKTSWLQSLST